MKRIPVKNKITTIRESSIINGDAIIMLKSLPNQSIDHCITDPPYNISGYDHKKRIGWLKSNDFWTKEKKFSKIDAVWDKFSNDDYMIFTKAWLSELTRVIKPNGNIIIFGSYHNIYKIGSILHDLDRKIINSIVWFKRNAFPNVTQRMLCESTEHIIWAANETQKKAKNWVFNYKDMKEINGGVQMRNVWNIPMTPRSEKKFGKHPSQKPLEVLSRLIRGMTNKGDMIIDPFMGSGTLPVVAQLLGRHYIGIDNKKDFCDLTIKRLQALEKEIV